MHFLTAVLLAPLAAAVPFNFTNGGTRGGNGGHRGNGNGNSGDKGTFLGLPISNPDALDIIPNRYIVVYNDTFDDDAVTSNIASFSAAVKKRNIGKRGLVGNMLSTEVHSLKMNKWRAMVLDADDLMINDIFNSDEVEYVEADTKVSSSVTIAQTNAPDGLIRLSHAAVGGDSYRFDPSAGAGITAYVVDTGILTTHIEFEGRATFGANFVNTVDTDENGHGSHVAGTIGGATVGVAKSVNLVAVKVLDANGSGSNSGVLNGMQFVIDDVQAKGITGKAVMNMSLGGSFSAAINRAIQALQNAGVVSVVAAGNEAVSNSLSGIMEDAAANNRTARHSQHVTRLCAQRHHRRRH